MDLPRAKKLLQPQLQEGGSHGYRTRHAVKHGETLSILDAVASYRRVARSLRDAVATAVSHGDTGQIVAFLDEQIAALAE